MQGINELKVREVLRAKLTAPNLLTQCLQLLADPLVEWEEKRGLWHFLFNTGYERVVLETLKVSLEGKERIPFDLLIALSAKAKLKPGGSVIEAILKGLKKQKAHAELFSAKGWDNYEERLPRIRAELLENKIKEHSVFKENLLEKFQFLKNQRMVKEAGQVLARMLQLYPDDLELVSIKQQFDEQWAREVLSNHLTNLQFNGKERTTTQPSANDEDMLRSFLREAEKVALEHRSIALDMAVAFWFLEDYNRALEILAWAPASASADWMKADVLFAARRFVDALEQLNQLEVKYIEDPETTFSVNYLRAQCLYVLGQQSSGLEIMQSIVRVRSHYRSAHALILEWSAGASWE